MSFPTLQQTYRALAIFGVLQLNTSVTKKLGPHLHRRWLFTGANGRIGRMMFRHWQSHPPAAHLIWQTRGLRTVPYVPGSVDRALAWDILEEPLPEDIGPIDCILGFAGVTPTTGSNLELNAALAESTLSAADRAGINRVLITSSSAVYGTSPDGTPLSEDYPINPRNDYGRSKVAMETVCALWRSRGLEVCCLRIGNVAGADALLLNAVTGAGKNLIIDNFADGAGPWRSYVGPETLAKITAALASYPGALPEVINIAAPNPVSMADLARAAEFNWSWQTAPASARQRITLDVGRLERLYQFAQADSDPAEMISQWHRTRDLT